MNIFFSEQGLNHIVPILSTLFGITLLVLIIIISVIFYKQKKSTKGVL